MLKLQIHWAVIILFLLFCVGLGWALGVQFKEAVMAQLEERNNELQEGLDEAEIKIDRVTAERDRLAFRRRRAGLALARANDLLHQKNLWLDSLHWVWSVNNPAGIHRYQNATKDELTEEVVLLAEYNTGRLRTRFEELHRPAPPPPPAVKSRRKRQ